jgi:hypothetical protein
MRDMIHPRANILSIEISSACHASAISIAVNLFLIDGEPPTFLPPLDVIAPENIEHAPVEVVEVASEKAETR